jgi:hypothetical protein
MCTLIDMTGRDYNMAKLNYRNIYKYCIFKIRSKMAEMLVFLYGRFKIKEANSSKLNFFQQTAS